MVGPSNSHKLQFPETNNCNPVAPQGRPKTTTTLSNCYLPFITPQILCLTC